jgi:hypothetical protein
MLAHAPSCSGPALIPSPDSSPLTKNHPPSRATTFGRWIGSRHDVRRTSSEAARTPAANSGESPLLPPPPPPSALPDLGGGGRGIPGQISSRPSHRCQISSPAAPLFEFLLPPLSPYAGFQGEETP